MLIQLLIIQILTFIGLLFVLRFIFTRNLDTALTRLNTLHEENLVKETQLSEELKLAQQEREAEVLKGKQEAGAIIEEAKKEALRLRQKLEEEARAQANKLISQAQAEAEELKQKAAKEIEEQSVRLAIKMISETFTEKDHEYLQQQFISEIIGEIAKLSAERFTVSTDKIKVVSSFALEHKQKDELKKVLEEKLKRHIGIEEEVNKELISGLVVDIGGLVIDGSLRNRLLKVIASLRMSGASEAIPKP